MRIMNRLGEHLAIISPHDDDAVLSAGGLIKARANKKLKTTVLIMTDGSLGYSTPEEKDIIVETRKKETEKCYKALGAEVIFLGFPDMSLNAYRCWDTPNGEEGAYKKVIRVLREINADCLLIPNPKDSHPDHKAAYDIGKVAEFQATSPVASELGEPIELKSVFCYGVQAQLPNLAIAHPRLTKLVLDHVVSKFTLNHKLTKEEKKAKAEGIKAYQSQYSIIKNLAEKSLGELDDKEDLIYTLFDTYGTHEMYWEA